MFCSCFLSFFCLPFVVAMIPKKIVMIRFLRFDADFFFSFRSWTIPHFCSCIFKKKDHNSIPTYNKCTIISVVMSPYIIHSFVRFIIIHTARWSWIQFTSFRKKSYSVSESRLSYYHAYKFRLLTRPSLIGVVTSEKNCIHLSKRPLIIPTHVPNFIL